MFSGSNLLETLLADRERRWRSGEQLTSEECMDKFPGVRDDAESAVSLIYQEYCLRAETGRRPTAAEFLNRFPEHAKRLRGQFQLRQAVLQVARKSVKRTRTARRAGLGEIGRYQLKRVLNRGQRSTVYEAINSRSGASVVVKLFDVMQENRAEFVRSLRDKAQAAGRLRHPNLRRINGVGLWKGDPYLVSDFVDGTTLAEQFQRKRGADEIRPSVMLVCKLAKGLAIVHDAGMIHGDILPAHVLLTAAHEPVLMDAGVSDLWRCAGLLADSSYCIVGLGEQVAIKSPRPYAAPEQHAGAASPASDVYALGVILHRLLTGKLPDSNPPAYHRPELDPVLDAIVKRAIAIDAAARFANGRELADAMSAWLKRSAFR